MQFNQINAKKKNTTKTTYIIFELIIAIETI